MITNFKVIIPICDANLFIIPILYKMYKKYWPITQQVYLLGFKTPVDYPKDWYFISMDKAQVDGANSWGRYLANMLANFEDEFVIFSLEDFIPIDYTRNDIFSNVFNNFVSQDTNVVRFELGWDVYTTIPHQIVASCKGYNIIEADKFGQYRISTQTSLWRRDYLVQLLKSATTPWDFETRVCALSYTDNSKVLACADPTFINYPAKWIHKGAVSRFHQGKFNVLGLKVDDIKELISEGLLNESSLMWGQWNGHVPSFHELGGYNFHPSKMPLHPASLSNWLEYYPIYA